MNIGADDLVVDDLVVQQRWTGRGLVGGLVADDLDELVVDGIAASVLEKGEPWLLLAVALSHFYPLLVI